VVGLSLLLPLKNTRSAGHIVAGGKVQYRFPALLTVEIA